MSGSSCSKVPTVAIAIFVSARCVVHTLAKEDVHVRVDVLCIDKGTRELLTDKSLEEASKSRHAPSKRA